MSSFKNLTLWLNSWPSGFSGLSGLDNMFSDVSINMNTIQVEDIGI